MKPRTLLALIPALALALLLWPSGDAQAQIDLTPPEVTRTPTPERPVDTTPPELVGLQFATEPFTSEVVATPSITVYAKITDDLSGVDGGSLRFCDTIQDCEVRKSVSLNPSICSVGKSFADRHEGEWICGWLYLPPRGSKWHLVEIKVWDSAQDNRAQNIRTYRYPFPNLLDRDAESAHADIGPRHTLYLPAVTR